MNMQEDIKLNSNQLSIYFLPVFPTAVRARAAWTNIIDPRVDLESHPITKRCLGGSWTGHPSEGRPMHNGWTSRDGNLFLPTSSQTTVTIRPSFRWVKLGVYQVLPLHGGNTPLGVFQRWTNTLGASQFISLKGDKVIKEAAAGRLLMSPWKPQRIMNNKSRREKKANRVVNENRRWWYKAQRKKNVEYKGPPH